MFKGSTYGLLRYKECYMCRVQKHEGPQEDIKLCACVLV